MATRIMRQPSRVALLGAALLGALAALAAILFIAWTAVSANAGAVTATFSEVTDASATRCENEIRSDSTCDLILRVFNTTSHPRTWTLDKILVDHAFDASTITPQTGTPGTTKTLGQCPCQYPIAAGATQTYKIHIEVGELRDGYTSGKIKVYPSAYNGGQFPPSTIANYQLDIEIATSITINTVTDTTIDLSWVGNVFATRAFIFWWPEGGTFDSVTPMTTKDSTYTITGLTPATKYQVRVQPYKSLTKYQAKQVEVTTKASATPPPVVGITASSDVTEGSLVTFTVSATPAPTSDLVVSLTITKTGDYGVTAGDRTVTITDSATSGTLSLPTNNDSLDEPNGTVTATLVDGTDYNLSANKTATVTVADNDDPPDKPYTKTSMSGGGITIHDTEPHRWRKIIERFINSPYDHAMGESQYVTYQVSVDAGNCPATVEISGGPRFYSGGAHYYNRNLEIIAGSAPPSPLPKPPGPVTISAELTFATGECGQPKPVTVYGLIDEHYGKVSDGTSAYGSYVVLTHKLTRRNGTAANITGPQFKVWAFDRFLIEMSGAVPAYDASASQTTKWLRIPLYSGRRVEYANGVGMRSHAGRSINADIRYGQETFVNVSRPPDATANPPIGESQNVWTEFCWYIHPNEKTPRNDDGIPVRTHWRYYDTLPLEQLTLIPFTFPDRFWYVNGDGKLPRVDHGGYTMPFEIQRYSSIVNPDGDCRPVASTDSGSWETVYSGGPRSNDQASYNTWKNQTVEPFVINWRDWGQFINVRIRTVYAVPETKPDTPTFRAPPNLLQIKFTFAEIISAFSNGSIVLEIGGR